LTRDAPPTDLAVEAGLAALCALLRRREPGFDFRPARPATPRSPVAGFRLVERRDADTYFLFRFRADKPVLVTPPRLAAASAALLSHSDTRGLPLIRPLKQRPAVRYTDHPESRPVSNVRLSVMVER